jgi:hypothetical protein
MSHDNDSTGKNTQLFSTIIALSTKLHNADVERVSTMQASPSFAMAMETAEDNIRKEKENSNKNKKSKIKMHPHSAFYIDENTGKPIINNMINPTSVSLFEIPESMMQDHTKKIVTAFVPTSRKCLFRPVPRSNDINFKVLGEHKNKLYHALMPFHYESGIAFQFDYPEGWDFAPIFDFKFVWNKKIVSRTLFCCQNGLIYIK